MNPEDRSPDNPHEWIRRAKSNLAKAKSGADVQGVYLEDLCFDAQQAVEKAVKSVLVSRRLSFPYVHDLARLMSLIETAGLPLPDNVRRAEALTRFATGIRYPHFSEAVTEEEYREALTLAEGAVRWAEEAIDSA